MSHKSDFSQFKEFAKAWQNANDGFEAFFKRFLLGMAQRALEEIVPNTPIKDGALRASWSVGEVTIVGSDIEVVIFNNMFYASMVEYGHRGVFVPSLGVTLHKDTHWTEGRFMMTMGIDLVQQQIPARFNEAYKAYLQSKGAV